MAFLQKRIIGRFLIIRIQFKDVSNQRKWNLRAIQRSTNNKAQFVLRDTNVGGSNTESLINHLNSKHIIHVILESEDHKTIPEQEEIRSQIVKKEMSLFEATKKRSNNLKETVPCLNYDQAQISGTRKGFFSHVAICHKI